VWKAITNRDDMSKWYFDLEEFRPEKGFTFEFTGGPAPDRQYIHVCTVTESVPERKLSYTWDYKGYEGSSEVTFELAESGNHTLLKFKHEGLQTFPSGNPDFHINNFKAGWNEILNVLLRKYLDNL
jgi:uncharacterized protein YndB with AHSA1/START domain